MDGTGTGRGKSEMDGWMDEKVKWIDGWNRNRKRKK